MRKNKRNYPIEDAPETDENSAPAGRYRALAGGIIVGALLLAVFVKFGVTDRFAAAKRAERSLSIEQGQLNALVAENAVFPEVQAEYDRHFAPIDPQADYADCMEVLSFIDAQLKNRAAIRSVSLSNDTLSVVLSNVSLEETSALVELLYKNEMISSVSVPSFEAAEKSAPAVSIAIKLNCGEAGAK